MKRRVGIVLLVPIVLVLAACMPTRHILLSPKPHASSSSAAPSASASAPEGSGDVDTRSVSATRRWALRNDGNNTSSIATITFGLHVATFSHT
ncbi:MAG TPA: hypothetical protein VIJ11_08840 [Galbitalea sp.]